MKLALPAILASFMLGSGLPLLAQGITPIAPPQIDRAGVHADAKEGLRSFLEELLAATKARNRKQVSDLIEETEIPNHRQWFLSMYPADNAESWIEPYEKNLRKNENALQQFFERIAASDGQFLIERQSEVPQPNSSLVWALLDNPPPSPEAYLATWKSTAGSDPRPQFIGFFYFIDGAFRWNSVVHFEPRSATAAGAGSKSFSGHLWKLGDVSPPRPIHIEAAQSTADARSARFQGTVILTLIVDTDGYAKQIKVKHSVGMGLDEKAVEAVQKWRFEPAKTRQGQPVPVAIAVEVRFRLD